MRLLRLVFAGIVALMMVLQACCASAETVGNLQELAEAILACAENGDAGFSFTCNQSVYDGWADDEYRYKRQQSQFLNNCLLFQLH